MCDRARSRAATAASPDTPAASQPPPVVDRTEREGERNREIARERWGQGLAVVSLAGSGSALPATGKRERKRALGKEREEKKKNWKRKERKEEEQGKKKKKKKSDS